MVSLGQSNSKEIFTGGGRLYAAGFNSSVFERMCREWTSLSASGKIILTVSEADAAMYQQKKNASGQHCVLTQTTKTSPGFLLILQKHRERFFCYFSAGSRCFSVNGTRGFHYASLRCGRGRRS